MNKLYVELNISKELEKKLNNVLRINKIKDIGTYLLELVDRDINSRIYFEKEFFFDYYRNKLFNGENEIPFSKLEYKIFMILLNNKNTIVTYEQFFNEIENISKSSLSILIARIKIKTYNRLIRTVRHRGYIMIYPTLE